MEERLEEREEKHEGISTRTYILVFLGLAVLTLLEVGAAQLPFATVPILLALASAKVLLVAMFYMHLKTDSRWYAYVFLVPIPFVVLIVASLLIGY